VGVARAGVTGRSGGEEAARLGGGGPGELSIRSPGLVPQNGTSCLLWLPVWLPSRNRIANPLVNEPSSWVDKASCGPTSPGGCGRWLPAWLPEPATSACVRMSENAWAAPTPVAALDGGACRLRPARRRRRAVMRVVTHRPVLGGLDQLSRRHESGKIGPAPQLGGVESGS
jgi:hypothetical protein